MKQVFCKGLKHIIVDEVTDPVVSANHVLVRPIYSLISSGTETACWNLLAIWRPAPLTWIWSLLGMRGAMLRYSQDKLLVTKSLPRGVSALSHNLESKYSCYNARNQFRRRRSSRR